MMQTLKGAVFHAITIFAACIKAIFKMCMNLLKVLLITVAFASMIFGALSAFLAVGPQNTPSWMAPAWETLNVIDPARLSSAIDGEALPLWEVQDSSVAISKWMSQMSTAASLLVSVAGLAREHWLRAEVELSLQHVDALVNSEPKVGQAVLGAWTISTVSILFLVVRFVIGIVRLVGGCVCPVYNCMQLYATAYTITTDVRQAAVETEVSGGSGSTPRFDIPEAGQALGENTSMNVATIMVTDEKKVGRKRFESPTIRTKINARKEDVPPVASPLRRKQSELNELREQGIVGRRLARAQY